MNAHAEVDFALNDLEKKSNKENYAAARLNKDRNLKGITKSLCH